jgi:hypothetical protein
MKLSETPEIFQILDRRRVASEVLRSIRDDEQVFIGVEDVDCAIIFEAGTPGYDTAHLLAIEKVLAIDAELKARGVDVDLLPHEWPNDFRLVSADDEEGEDDE